MPTTPSPQTERSALGEARLEIEVSLRQAREVLLAAIATYLALSAIAGGGP